MSKIPKSKWTADEKKFSDLVDKMDSKDQITRIDGRLEFGHFKERFTKEELDAMWERIK